MVVRTERNPAFFKLNKNSHAKMRLICFPFAGGSASSYREWGRHFPEFEVVAVQYPGRGSRMGEKPHQTITDLIEELFSDAAFFQEKPVLFFGHSMGAIVAFELACMLHRNGFKGPGHLFVSGREAPHLTSSQEKICSLPDDEFIQKLKEYNGTPEEVLNNQELLNLILSTIRSDFRAIETYRLHSRVVLNCPISVFYGSQDPFVCSERIGGWSEHTTQNTKEIIMDGDHFFIYSKQFIAEFQNELRTYERSGL